MLASDNRLQRLLREVRGCTACAKHLPLGPRPVLRMAITSRLLIVGQAPGTRVHETGIPWNDPSGDRLREWMDVPRDVFYDETQIAIVPMGFCYPGRDVRGGDLPPRPECAELWRERLHEHLPNVELTLLIGQYAHSYYLGARRGKSLTETVQHWQKYLPTYLPLPHPSWRNQGWLKRHPWFEADVVPYLRARVRELLEIR